MRWLPVGTSFTTKMPSFLQYARICCPPSVLRVITMLLSL
jgi:hypothetical protein